MEGKRFRKNNQAFICINCGHDVPVHPTSSRDHCNNCLYSLHVDINPGDRLNKCRGQLKPVGMEIKNGKERIIYKCQKCGEIEKCITAPDDSSEEIIRLSKLVWEE